MAIVERDGEAWTRKDDNPSLGMWQTTGGLVTRPDVCKHFQLALEVAPCDLTARIPWELSSGRGITIRAEEAWKVSRGSPYVTIAIIDEGFDVRGLPAGAEFEVLRASECAAASSRFSTASHGARLSELIAGSRDGYPGVAPGCRLLLIELPSFCTEVEEAYAFDLALQFNAAAVCCSWGPEYRGPNVSLPMPTAVATSIERLAREGRGGLGCMVFFAAGNHGSDVGWDGYASHPLVTTVGGITRRGDRPPGTDFGNKIEIAAPVSSPNGVIGGTPGLPAGTSGATALVTGVAGLVFSVNPDLCASQARKILKRTAVDVDHAIEGVGSQPGVVDAGKAVLEARRAIPRKETFSNRTTTATPRVTPKIGKREFRERRYNGGEHSYFGLTAAYMLRGLYSASPDLSTVFFGSPFSAYSQSGINPFYQPMVGSAINSFFADNPPQSGNWPVKDISNYPSLNTDSGESIPFGYLVGLAADLYGQPSDMVSAFSHLPSGLNNFKIFIDNFQREIVANFKFPDDFELTWASVPDNFANYINLATKNYSHFAGHNLLFYISYHLLAVSDAINCATAAKSGNQAQVHAYFNTALIEEAFALHFLTDMFSSGHARVPRWAFLYGEEWWRVAAGISGIGEADLLSKLLHDFEGIQGVLVMNSAEDPTAQQYFWKIYGDGSLNLNQILLDQPEDLVYLVTPTGTIGNAKRTIGNAKLASEPIQLGSYMPSVRGKDSNLRRLDLITGLMCVSMADVFRHMADDMPPETSAQGATAQTGLLGYVLQRVPFALPIGSELLSVGVSDDSRDALMKVFYPSGSGETPGYDYATTELSARLMADNFKPLFDVYKSINWAVRAKALQIYFIPDFFNFIYCRDKFLASPPSTSTLFERLWVGSQTGNLQTAFDPPANLMRASVVPSILKGTADFASTIVGSFVRPGALNLPTLPLEWIKAVPTKLTKALLSDPGGVWGIDR